MNQKHRTKAMASNFIILFIASLMFFHLQCNGEKCTGSDIAVKLVKTGRVVEGDAEYEVTMSNNCEKCTALNVHVQCFGLSSVEAVDETVIRPETGTDRCIVNNGKPISQGSPVKFKYAWLTPQDFPVVSYEFKC